MLSDLQRRTAALKLYRILGGDMMSVRLLAASMRARPDEYAAAFRGIDPNEITAKDFFAICERVWLGA
jgi:hypothetical protein